MSSVTDIQRLLVPVREAVGYHANMRADFLPDIAERLTKLEEACNATEVMKELLPKILKDLDFLKMEGGINGQTGSDIAMLEQAIQDYEATEQNAPPPPPATFVERLEPTGETTGIPAQTVGSAARLLALMIKRRGAYASDGPGLFDLVTEMKEKGIIPSTTVMQKLAGRGPENSERSR